jgi:AraC family transcriptional activator of pobA
MIKIPIHKLQDKTEIGFQIKAFNPEHSGPHEAEKLGAHRDDHYIFFILLEGSGSAIVDFEHKTVHAHQLYYILPQQIHYRITTTNVRGWFIAADPALINPILRNTFERSSGFQEPVTMDGGDEFDLDQLLGILHRKSKKPSPGVVSTTMLHTLLHAFFEMAAVTIHRPEELNVSGSRQAEISVKFKGLLSDSSYQYTSPSMYAEKLHITEAYLNESVKKVTGSSVTFWIKYRAITEAKRLLYFTDSTVKQIAAELGFNNHSYFCRLFRNETKMTPLTFRKKTKTPSYLQ